VGTCGLRLPFRPAGHSPWPPPRRPPALERVLISYYTEVLTGKKTASGSSQQHSGRGFRVRAQDGSYPPHSFHSCYCTASLRRFYRGRRCPHHLRVSCSVAEGVAAGDQALHGGGDEVAPRGAQEAAHLAAVALAARGHRAPGTSIYRPPRQPKQFKSSVMFGMRGRFTHACSSNLPTPTLRLSRYALGPLVRPTLTSAISS